jgi:hypothetical protein
MPAVLVSTVQLSLLTDIKLNLQVSAKITRYRANTRQTASYKYT